MVYYQKVPDWHIGLARGLCRTGIVWFFVFVFDGLYKGYTMNGLFSTYVYFDML